PMVESLTIDGHDEEVADVWLYLSVTHPNPSALDLALEGSDGRRISFSLPPGLANFEGVIGTRVGIATFSPFEGVPVDGVWSIWMMNTEEGLPAHYLDAALFFETRKPNPEGVMDPEGDMTSAEPEPDDMGAPDIPVLMDDSATDAPSDELDETSASNSASCGCQLRDTATPTPWGWFSLLFLLVLVRRSWP